MPRRIEEDHSDFRSVIGGKIRRALQKYIKSGRIFRTRGDGSKINITIPRIELPHIVYGQDEDGIGRGKGEDGKLIGKDDDGQGQGNQAGTDPSEGITVSIDLEEVLKFLQYELALPDLKPKLNQTYEEIRIKYNDIALQGPESLRHSRRTLLQALKRMSASGEINNLHLIPGFSDPVRLITPVNQDRRYRQYREIKVPSSNAVVFFARDGSGSMDSIKCDIVSDMSWWVDIWLRKFYKRVERCYVWHDTVAEEVDEHRFYNYRYGGGTICSSAFKLIAGQFENRFPPEKWNIYVMYFSDGENWNDDNDKLNKIITEQFSPNIVNFVGITQILCWSPDGSLKSSIDSFAHKDNVRTTSINYPAKEEDEKKGPGAYPFPYYHSFMPLTEEQRNEQIRNAIVELLGVGADKKETKKKDEIPF